MNCKDLPLGELGHLRYAGDSLAREDWDKRDWKHAAEVRETLLDLAIDAVRSLEDLT